jgi:hypothetical protein
METVAMKYNKIKRGTVPHNKFRGGALLSLDSTTHTQKKEKMGQPLRTKERILFYLP